MKNIAVATSGGDAPGMNAAIRSVVRAGIANKLRVWGVHRGYRGLIDGDIEELTSRDVSGIIQRGGTILQTARCEEFKTEPGQRLAMRNLNQHGIDGVVVIGGDGSLHGAQALQAMGMPVVGIPGSIDNDLPGTELSLGVDTALNTIIQAIDRIRDTAASHNRAFIVQVMGRNCGYLAMMSGIASGAEMVITPDLDIELGHIERELRDGYVRGKSHFIVVVAEGAKLKADQIARHLQETQESGFETRVTILGHVQRGGSPSFFDRILATRFGVAAVENLISGNTGIMVGIQGDRMVATPLDDVLNAACPLFSGYFTMAEMLAR